MRQFNGWSDAKKMTCLPKLFRSLFTGDIDHAPEPLHVLLSARAESVGDAVLWVPFYLEYLLKTLTVNCQEHQKLMEAMGDLLQDCQGAVGRCMGVPVLLSVNCALPCGAFGWALCVEQMV